METSPLAMGRARYRLHPPGRGPGRGDRTSPRQPFKNLPLPKGETKKAIEMAKAMKTDGESMDRIVKYTRLSMEEIQKL